jgi:hypothetical protein
MNCKRSWADTYHTNLTKTLGRNFSQEISTVSCFLLDLFVVFSAFGFLKFMCHPEQAEKPSQRANDRQGVYTAPPGARCKPRVDNILSTLGASKAQAGERKQEGDQSTNRLPTAATQPTNTSSVIGATAESKQHEPCSNVVVGYLETGSI